MTLPPDVNNLILLMVPTDVLYKLILVVGKKAVEREKIYRNAIASNERVNMWLDICKVALIMEFAKLTITRFRGVLNYSIDPNQVVGVMHKPTAHDDELEYDVIKYNDGVVTLHAYDFCSGESIMDFEMFMNVDFTPIYYKNSELYEMVNSITQFNPSP